MFGDRDSAPARLLGFRTKAERENAPKSGQRGPRGVGYLLQ